MAMDQILILPFGISNWSKYLLWNFQNKVIGLNVIQTAIAIVQQFLVKFMDYFNTFFVFYRCNAQ